MTPLRQRMIQDMQIRNLSPRTIECYTYHVSRFAQHFGRSPETPGPDEVHAWQVHLVQERKVSMVSSGRHHAVAPQPPRSAQPPPRWAARWLARPAPATILADAVGFQGEIP